MCFSSVMQDDAKVADFQSNLKVHIDQQFCPIFIKACILVWAQINYLVSLFFFYYT